MGGETENLLQFLIKNAVRATFRKAALVVNPGNEMKVADFIQTCTAARTALCQVAWDEPYLLSVDGQYLTTAGPLRESGSCRWPCLITSPKLLSFRTS